MNRGSKDEDEKPERPDRNNTKKSRSKHRSRSRSRSPPHHKNARRDQERHDKPR